MFKFLKLTTPKDGTRRDNIQTSVNMLSAQGIRSVVKTYIHSKQQINVLGNVEYIYGTQKDSGLFLQVI